MRTVIIIVVFIGVSVLTYLGFYNAFYQPKFTIVEEGGEIIVYQPFHGQYHQSDSIMKVVFYELYERNGIVITKGFGQYFDNPFESKDEKISFVAGCIVEDKDSLLLAAVSDGFVIDYTHTVEYVVTDFPLKGRMSIMFGMKKVYPKLKRFCVENGLNPNLPVTEIYDRETKRIHYRMEAVKN